MTEDLNRSRFFTTDDPNSDVLLYRFPDVWWSRLYEYEWAKQFVGSEDVVLDAAAGIVHPFKFYVGTAAREAHACDLNPLIASPEGLLAEIAGSWFGPDVAALVESRYLPLVRLKQGNLMQLPYADDYFDKVFCISVLEEMPEADQLTALLEFRRVLRPGGRIILTFDYPHIDLGRFQRHMEQAGLAFAGETDFALPANAVYTTMWGGIYCFRAVLRKD
ncbi:class I SAM-dependent methyltransferase [Paenibacillus methanolicus]|uniref:Methyltransferase family protein n=1 Tax=Paenibacillus methanolicus TaxID=582686 RepID=A0A5S5CKH8_9BACL|nr:class I SAM-dependent methyltransferase [Paenibacillus methanolicus]TYP79483.1 methyltransferase family protein [Paenibacillus methanolicus]